MKNDSEPKAWNRFFSHSSERILALQGYRFYDVIDLTRTPLCPALKRLLGSPFICGGIV